MTNGRTVSLRSALDGMKRSKVRLRKNAQWPALWSASIHIGNILLHAGGFTPREAFDKLFTSPIVRKVMTVAGDRETPAGNAPPCVTAGETA